MPWLGWPRGSGWDEMRLMQVENAVIELVQQLVNIAERVEALEKKVAEMEQA
jgi:hypothetical protein